MMAIMWIMTAIFIVIASVIIYGQIRSARIYRELLESVTSLDRGNRAERDLVVALLKAGIAPGAIFHDLYVKKSNGGFSQIDLVVATKSGIIVFEVKDYSGWIFGNGNQTNWTQVLAYGNWKFRFYNPVKQNQGHIRHLRESLGENVPFYSVILFSGNCHLRDISSVPQGTTIVKPRQVSDVVSGIINDNEPANYTDKRRVVAVLKQAVENGNLEGIEDQHIDNVRNMLRQNRNYH